MTSMLFANEQAEFLHDQRSEILSVNLVKRFTRFR